MKSQLLGDLESRNILHTISANADDHLQSPRTIYAGFDPTAQSLTLGHVAPLMLLRRARLFGHPTIALVGGATARIGDPSGKNSERDILSEDAIRENERNIRIQIESILDVKVVNNIEWHRSITVIDFLRDVGKKFSTNYMLNKESVKNRLESGLSFAEFSYQILQAQDFLHLNKKFNCTVQIGGSDQWGNICSGIHLISKIQQTDTFGVTCNLITKSDGTKFGKSESGTLWLDETLTPPYEMFHYLINLDDATSISLLRSLSTLSLEEIEQLNLENKSTRAVQNALAKSIIAFVHGFPYFYDCKKMSEKLFDSSSTMREIISFNDEVKVLPMQSIAMDDNKPLVEFLVDICGSKGAARRLIKAKGVSVNKQLVTDENLVINRSQLIDNKHLLIITGKKNFHFFKVE